MPYLWIALAAGLMLAIVAVRLWITSRKTRHREQLRSAVAAFEGRLPALADEFHAAASATGKPRGLRWKSCDFGDSAQFAIDRVSDELYALAPVTISFEAVEGGGMEEVEAVGNLRTASAVFVHRDGDWTTDGRAVFNLEPAEAIKHYDQSLRPLEPI